VFGAALRKVLCAESIGRRLKRATGDEIFREFAESQELVTICDHSIDSKEIIEADGTHRLSPRSFEGPG